MTKQSDLAQIKNELSAVHQLVHRIHDILPGLTELTRLSGNLDRLGPRLELIDQIGPRLDIIDQIGPRLDIIDQIGPRLDVLDSLATLVEPLKRLTARIQLLDELGEVLRQFAANNHLVSESVRVDVETISALALQVELFNRQLLDQLDKVLERG